MCGRYNLRTPPDSWAEIFELLSTPDWQPRYNIAPTQTVPIVRLDVLKQREMALVRWGLVPSWADDLSISNKLFNARSETASSKPAFRSAFKSRRCLIPVDGFYEWQKTGRQKQPMHITRDDGRTFAFAGLWERWDRGAVPVESCTILTTDANDLMRPIHDRMPVIIPPEDYERWLAVATPAEELQALIQRPDPGAGLVTYPVRAVSEEGILPLTAPPQRQLQFPVE